MENNKENKNVHVGHRQRLRARAIETNLEGFEEHQILELLLTFVIPQKDTNPIAHLLIKEFGSLSGVLNADLKELAKVKGISEYSASFLVLLKDVFRKYKQSSVRSITTIKNTKEAIEVCKSELADLLEERVLVICVDNSNKVINKKIIAVGDDNKTTVSIRKIVDIVVRTNTSNIILAHNHPNGISKPSAEDDVTTKNLVFSLALSGVTILDNIVVGTDGCYSYFANGKLSEYYDSVNKGKMFAFNQNSVTYEK